MKETWEAPLEQACLKVSFWEALARPHGEGQYRTVADLGLQDWRQEGHVNAAGKQVRGLPTELAR